MLIFEKYVISQQTMAEIGEELGITESRICQILQQNNIRLRLMKRLGLDTSTVKKITV